MTKVHTLYAGVFASRRKECEVNRDQGLSLALTSGCPMPAPRTHRTHLLLAATLVGAWVPVHAQTCSALSAAHRTPVVELYTSEGCNSCPPADRWLSALARKHEVVALAFHVDYWDRLGWADRFASPAFTQRQAQQQSVNGSRYSYTPQVVINGADRKDWPGVSINAAARPTANVQISLGRSGDKVAATVQTSSSARLSAYWAVTESGHSTAVKGGENSGVMLKHDHVVRELLPVPAWAATAGVPTTLQFQPRIAATPGHLREVNLVVLDADTGKPVQALKLAC
jgi:hypothetical protein